MALTTIPDRRSGPQSVFVSVKNCPPGTSFSAFFARFWALFAKRTQLIFYTTYSCRNGSEFSSWVRSAKTPFLGNFRANRRQRCSSGLLACRVRSRLGRPVAALASRVLETRYSATNTATAGRRLPPPSSQRLCQTTIALLPPPQLRVQ